MPAGPLGAVATLAVYRLSSTAAGTAGHLVRTEKEQPVAYFQRTGVATFQPTGHVSGAWDPEDQHIAPSLGLMAHEVELDRLARGRDDLVLARLSYDIWGTVPLGAVEIVVRVLRPGRTIELVEAELSHAGRRIVTLRAWLMQPGETADLQATSLPAIPGPDATPAWDPSSVWPGGFIASAEVRRSQTEPGGRTSGCAATCPWWLTRRSVPWPGPPVCWTSPTA